MNAQPPELRAEVAEIWPRDGRVRIVGDFHGGTDSDSDPGRWHLVSEVRGTDIRMQHELKVEGSRFEVSVPLEDFVPRGPDPSPVGDDGLKWDLYVVRDDRLDQGADGRLRLGRRLDDIRNKRKIMVFPAQEAEDDGVRMTVRPVYTVHEDLSIDCTPGTSGSPGKESP
ncbi:hypothetical protein LP52_03680 [Streptomonospora alba]|uniref:Uncharacterized protein n=1 Tax=Streptomonospora alba TaxID=183763 RepID=A0A0C2JM70_9ACTN|nr:hypothetical protein [Streptomonospora alba]KII00051.1 hypothetical protein LP52_03680 [Streptomonospora alba]